MSKKYKTSKDDYGQYTEFKNSDKGVCIEWYWVDEDGNRGTDTVFLFHEEMNQLIMWYETNKVHKEEEIN